MNRKLISITIALLGLTPKMDAQEPAMSADSVTIRPVTAAYTIGIGSAKVTDTYLSPLTYKGTGVGLDYERMQAMAFDPERWVMRLGFGVDLDKTNNPARNASIWDLDVDFNVGVMRRWRMTDGLTIGVGPGTTLTAGALYSTRNSNNPVSAKASWTIDATGYAAFTTRLWGLPLTLREQATLPVSGAFFSPQYGELYYEIYLGDKKGLAHVAWWGNYFGVNNLVTADLHIGATSIRLGWELRYLTTEVNNITTRRLHNMFVLGLSGEWLSLNLTCKSLPQGKIIHALY